MFSIQALSQFNRQKLVQFKNACGENRPNKTLPGTREIRETCTGYAQAPMIFFNRLRFKKRQFCFNLRFGYVNKDSLLITVLTTIY